MVLAATTEEQEPEAEQQQQKSNKKKKRKLGFLSADSPADIKRVHDARLLSLRKMKAANPAIPLKMGLATLDKAARHKIAVMGGLTRAADKAGLARAGKLGGDVVRSTYGLEYYKEIGKEGAAVKESFSMEIISDIAAPKKGRIRKRAKCL